MKTTPPTAPNYPPIKLSNDPVYALSQIASYIASARFDRDRELAVDGVKAFWQTADWFDGLWQLRFECDRVCQQESPNPKAKTGVQLIAEERQRQIEEEGWSPEHDDTHTEGQLRTAAECYVFELRSRSALVPIHKTPPPAWPWDKSWWKPTHDNIRQLVKAGALIAAEIDRLQKEANKSSES